MRQSDIERRLNDLKETILTPIERLTATSSAGRDAEAHLALWAAMFYTLKKNEQRESGVGLITMGNGNAAARQILVFKPLAENTRIQLDIHSRMKVSKLSGRVRISKRMDVSAFSIFCYDLAPENESSP